MSFINKTNQQSDLSNEIAKLMENNLSGKTAEIENYNAEKISLIDEIKSGIDLFDELNNKKASEILKKVLLKVASV